MVADDDVDVAFVLLTEELLSAGVWEPAQITQCTKEFWTVPASRRRITAMVRSLADATGRVLLNAQIFAHGWMMLGAEHFNQ